jgi:dTMP kinase
MKGFFITFESMKDGLGKSTQAKLLYEKLKQNGHNVVLTFEPGSTEMGKHIRELLLKDEYKKAKVAELFLFMADRGQHYEEVLKPALAQGKIVVCDRYFDSTIAYQGFARGWDVDDLWYLHGMATGQLMPDLTIILDGKPFKEMDSNDTFEKMGDEFYNKVKEGMMYVAKRYKERCVLLNANHDKEVLSDQIYSIVQERLLNNAKGKM